MVEQETGIGENRERYVDLVFEGGGVKGIALVGAFSVLEERGYEPQNMAGASAGAIVAVLIAAGYSSAELRKIIGELDYDHFKDEAWEDRIPLAGRSLSVLKDLGIYEGEAFLVWMRDLLEAKGIRTFGDLVRREDAELKYRYKAQVIASDVTERRLLVLPRDAPKLGIENPDDLNVALAVRMSMSIPIFFEPVKFANAQTGREHLIVDGGMLSNFPVWLFDAEEPQWPTFGLKLVEKDPRSPIPGGPPQPERSRSGVLSVVAYLRSLVDTMMAAHDRLYIEESDFDRTIAIDTLGVRTTEFDLSEERALKLFESGRTAAEKFLGEDKYRESITRRTTSPETPGSRTEEHDDVEPRSDIRSR
ncbi:MAG: lysophospholipase-like family protein [uncultured Rubrobacteraceae bacterium]|uniref:Lysophospholipase-like family protein n=1 Tax=uncultured Rubrobacteraceae bacterium TaxID=349277 RepID=A0A6J4QXE2_9ACTN|nr:MAG: lysophospholipase-like family protein [uncultured Rubrobacteraceae bacterium]